MEYIVYDLETTGLSSTTDSIIEVAGFRVCDGVVISSFSEVVKSEKYVPTFIRELTGLTEAHLRVARTPQEVLPEFYDFCGNLPLVGYNLSFDYGMLTEKLRLLGFDFTLSNRRNGLDVLDLVKKHLSYLQSKKLDNVISYLNIPVPLVDGRGSHCAKYDAYATKLLLDGFLNTGVKPVFKNLYKRDTKEYGGIINNATLEYE